MINDDSFKKITDLHDYFFIIIVETHEKDASQVEGNKPRRNVCMYSSKYYSLLF